MKQLCFLALMVLFFTIPLFSQSYDYTGGYGHFFTGPALIEPSDLVHHLQKPSVLGPSFNWDNVGITTGGEGMAEIHQLLVGGGGFGIVVPDMSSDSGTVKFGYGGGGLKVGYVFKQDEKFFMSLVAGFGGGVMYIGVENNSVSTPVYFSSTFPILPRGEEDYFMGNLIYDVALNTKLIATRVDPDKKSFGGFMLGLDLGTIIGVPIGNWYNEDRDVNGIPSPGTVISPYLRLTIGGGGFKKHEISRQKTSE
jgi:hypothetical protein